MLIRLINLLFILGFSIVAQNIDDLVIFNSDNSGLIYNQIHCIEFDSQNRLWVGTENGLCIMENNQNWISMEEMGAKQIPPNIKITALEWSNNAINPSMFIGTIDGIIKTDLNMWELNYGSSCASNNGSINSLLYEQGLWVGSNEGLCIEDVDNTWSSYNTSSGLYSNNISCIKKNNNSNLIGIGTLNGGLVTYNNEFEVYYSNNSDILDNTILDLEFDQNNNIILCTPAAGLGILTASGSWIWFNDINSELPTNSLKKVIVDNNNNIWIATLEDGLVHYRNNTFYNYNTSNSNIPDNKINCLQLDSNNNLWLGTESAGLVKINIPTINHDNNINSNINIYPTIFDHEINVKIYNTSNIQITNETGKALYNEKLNSGDNTINTSNYKPGFYILKIYDKQRIYNFKKLIKI